MSRLKIKNKRNPSFDIPVEGLNAQGGSVGSGRRHQQNDIDDAVNRIACKALEELVARTS